ncbi:hypothetical protein GCM10023314_30520 [Algibacter agarivorans]|uniref:Type I restriction modification DNA specificity domain-containing protein n=1 Tax=Algibacter agarivorans TaxID=1109741 RepID=A0ABP9H3T4_9FLAO
MNNIYLNVFYDNLDKYIKIMNDELSKSLDLQPLGEHIKMVGGFAFKSRDYIQSGVPIIRISDFNNEKIDLSSVKYYKEGKSLERYELNQGDIIIAMTGGTIGKLAIVQEGLGKLYLNQRVGKFEVLNPDEFESEYVYWLARGIQSIVQNLGYGGAQPNVSNKQIEALKFPFPDKRFQRSIVSFFNDLKDECVSGIYFNQEIENKILELQEIGVKIQTININAIDQFDQISKLRQSILQEAVQGKLTADWRKKNPNLESASELLKRIKNEKEQLIAKKKIKKEKQFLPVTKDEIPYELPDYWEWCRFLESCINRDGERIPLSKAQRALRQGAYDYYGAQGVIDHIDDFLFNERLLLIAEDGGNLLRRTKPVAYFAEGKYWVNNHAHVVDSFDKVTIAYLAIYINSIDLSPYLNGQPPMQIKLNQGRLNQIPLPLPPLNEQKAIVSKVNELMTHCDQLEKQVEESKLQAEQLIQAVLQEVFNPKQKENSDDVIEALFPNLETIAEVANLQQAMIIQKTELGLGSGRGKVYAQKTSANLKNIFGVDIPYTFEKSHYGEFSYQLSDDLDKNPYLRKVKTDVGEILEVKSSKQQEVLKALNAPENALFIQSIDELIKVYQSSLISGSTDRVELLNTVWRAIKDTKSLLGNTIYRYLENWEIKQGDYKTKADKFTKSETFAMITLIKDLGWDKKLIK